MDSLIIIIKTRIKKRILFQHIFNNQTQRYMQNLSSSFKQLKPRSWLAFLNNSRRRVYFLSWRTSLSKWGDKFVSFFDFCLDLVVCDTIVFYRVRFSSMDEEIVEETSVKDHNAPSPRTRSFKGGKLKQLHNKERGIWSYLGFINWSPLC